MQYTPVVVNRARRSASAAVALLVVSAFGAAQPQSIPVVNAGFEDLSVGVIYNEFSFGPPAGWVLHDPNSITNGGAGNTFYVGTLTPFEADPVGNPGVYVNYPGGAAQGQRVAIAFNFAGSGGQGEYGLEQTLSAVLAPFTSYTLRVEIGNIASGTAVDGTFFDLDGFPGYRVDLLAGGVVVAQDDNGLSGAIGEGTFGTSTIVLSTGSTHPRMGQALGIRLVNLNVVDAAFPGANLEVNFDDVRLDALALVVPYCFGSATSCPCANDGGPDRGCANSTGVGAALNAAGSASAAADDLLANASFLPPGQPAILLGGLNAPNGGQGLPFGDGLRCVGGGLVRLGVRNANALGSATWGPGLVADSGYQAGQTRRFAVWYRNPVGSPCGAGFNFTHGLEVTFH